MNRTKPLAAANRDTKHYHKEPILTQIASFIELFVWLLVLKSFFLPLFIIPTGSMAQTLSGAHATHTCQNCGFEYPVGFHTPNGPSIVQCPNCRQQQWTRQGRADGIKLAQKAGDRIVVHGWPFDIGGLFAPQRWDVVVFKNPNEPSVNFIKRLIGLPGDTIEIIDGDIFVQSKNETELHPAQKTTFAQKALWTQYYNHDYPPTETTTDWAAQHQHQRQRWPKFHPRWITLQDHSNWTAFDTRTPLFDGLNQNQQQIQFVTQIGDNPPPGKILDVYGYNSTGIEYDNVTDVRLSTDIELLAGDGFVELSISKYHDSFHTRLYADGRLTLEHNRPDSTQRETWASIKIQLAEQPLSLAIGHADYRVTVDLNGETLLTSSPGQYKTSSALARQNSRLNLPPTIRVAAQNIKASLKHLLIERDVYYTSGLLRDGRTKPGTGTQGNPITLKDDAYFMCGDNSPGSHDSRAWSSENLGPHLRAAYAAGKYDIGTVPADQMIGRAFLVYWPGFMPLGPNGPNLLPDLGRVRWIH